MPFIIMTNSIPLSQEAFRDLYLEVIAFLNSCGGIYRNISGRSCAKILYCLDKGQYYLKRNEEGEIVEFCSFWTIAPDDVEGVMSGAAPSITGGGSVLYILDHGNRGGNVFDLIRALRKSIKGQGVLWRHKRGAFRYFPRQKGDL